MIETNNEKSVILSIRGLEKSFGELDVLKGVDLDIRNGEKIVLKDVVSSMETIETFNLT